MEDMKLDTNITNAAIEEVMEAVPMKTGGTGNVLKTVGIATGSAAVGIGLWEGGKWAYRKIKRAWQRRQAKKKATIVLKPQDVRDVYPDVEDEYPID